jgi:hypothetical protein
MKSTLRTSIRCLRRGLRGQSMVEYVIVCAALAAARFVPLPGSQPQQAVGQMLASKIHDLYDNLTFFLSLP